MKIVSITNIISNVIIVFEVIFFINKMLAFYFVFIFVSNCYFYLFFRMAPVVSTSRVAEEMGMYDYV